MSFIDRMKERGLTDEQLTLVQTALKKKQEHDQQRGKRFEIVLEDTEAAIVMKAMLAYATQQGALMNDEGDPEAVAQGIAYLVCLCAVEDKIRAAVAAKAN